MFHLLMLKQVDELNLSSCELYLTGDENIVISPNVFLPNFMIYSHGQNSFGAFHASLCKVISKNIEYKIT